MDSKTFYSHGKLLISGEYLVLKGACALALPLRFGQKMLIEKSKNSDCIWEVYEKEKAWFFCHFNPTSLDIIKTDDEEKARLLMKALRYIYGFNPYFDKELVGAKITNTMEFKQEWGFGSSSTFVNNLATWSNIDPYLLQGYLFTGSGYDIACASNDQPIFFQIMFGNKVVELTQIQEEIKPFLYFIYLGKKQNSRESIQYFERNEQSGSDQIETISTISKKISQTSNYYEFSQLIEQHEEVLSEILGMKTLKKSRFADLDGSIKSLGGWGGDFAMICTQLPEDNLREYLRTKSIFTCFNYKDLVLDE